MHPAHQLVSVPFWPDPEHPGQVQYLLSGCAEFFIATSGNPGGRFYAEIDASVPYEAAAGCPPRLQSLRIDAGPGTQHAPLGPQIALQS
jgi:hypothetical protein